MNKIGLYGPSNIQKPKTIEKANNGKVEGFDSSGTKSVKKDSVTISEEARVKAQASDVQYLKGLVGKPEGTDQKKLDSIKQQIQNGTYQKDLSLVADSILEGLA